MHVMICVGQNEDLQIYLCHAGCCMGFNLIYDDIESIRVLINR